MRTELLRLDLRLRRRMLIGTAAGAAAYLLLIVAMYPSFQRDTSIDSMIQANPAAAAAFGVSGSITSPSGWLSGNMYANIAPLLGLLLTIGYGAAAIAGQNTEGTLGIVATLPVSRTRIVLQKASALLLAALVVPVASYAVCLAGPHFQLHPNWGALLGVTIALTLLSFDFGATALMLGALTASRGVALGVASGSAAAAYLLSSLAPVIHAIHSVRWLSPFYWAVGDDQLANGPTAWELTALAALGVTLVAATIPAFRRLDIL
ncbi:MAG: ABC transporter permease subunit [Dermatophilaceae bacterium]